MPRSPSRRSIPRWPVLVVVAACGGAPADPPPPDPGAWEIVLTPQSAGTDVLWVALSPVDADTVWLAGTGGSWARSVDGGSTWSVGVVEGAAELEFRDVEAFDASTAVLLAAGTGSASRLYRTEDGGATWTETYVMEHPQGFLDCLAFHDADRGLVYGDAVDEVPWLLRTSDGGRSWTRVGPEFLPAALAGEGGFAASGTCVAVGDDGRVWVGTGAAERPRVLYADSIGGAWSAVDVPLRAGGSAGVTTLGVRADGRGFALGGDLDPEAGGERTALTDDGGRSWRPGGPLAMAGAPYGGAWLPDDRVAVLFAAGPTGIDWSRDGGSSWEPLSTDNHWAVGFGSPRVGWAVGRSGRITRIDVETGEGS